MSSRLTLSVLVCPPGTSPEMRVVDAPEYRIGRSPENDWVLPPDPYVSKQHCVLQQQGAFWHVLDRSSNGTFLNGEPVGTNASRRLQSGDRLRFGGFEVEVGMDANPFTLDPVGQSYPPSEPSGWGGNGISLPSDPRPPTAPSPFGTAIEPGSAIHEPFVPRTGPGLRDGKWWEQAPAREPEPPVRPPAAGPRRSVWAVQEPTPEPPVVTSEPAPPPSPPPAPDADALLKAFLAGAGLPELAPANPEQTMRQLGAVMRALVKGLRQTLDARAAVKSEFRIEQTRIRRTGNNPLKFADGDDDALAALISGSRQTTMSPEAAVTEALRDIRLHELATMHAMQAAVRAIVARVDPAALRAQADKGGGLSIQRRARAWDAFVALHALVQRSLGDDFDSVFGKNFARAYEQAQAELANKED